MARRPWRPWLRAGVIYASGDDDARDDTHQHVLSDAAVDAAVAARPATYRADEPARRVCARSGCSRGHGSACAPACIACRCAQRQRSLVQRHRRDRDPRQLLRLQRSSGRSATRARHAVQTSRQIRVDEALDAAAARFGVDAGGDCRPSAVRRRPPDRLRLRESAGLLTLCIERRTVPVTQRRPSRCQNSFTSTTSPFSTMSVCAGISM